MQGSAGTFATAFAALLLLPSAAALLPARQTPGDPSPYANNAIHAIYTTRVLDSLDGFDVGVVLHVQEVEIPPAGGHSAAEVRAAPEPLRLLFEGHARSMILSEGQRVLPEARVRLAEFTVDYGHEDYDADPYDPPLEIRARLKADFTPAFFGLPANAVTPAREIARALLYSGGVYTVEKNLEIEPGFRVEHVVDVPSFLTLKEPGGPPAGRLVFQSDNLDGVSPGRVRLAFGIRLHEGSTPANVLAGPLVRARFVVDDATPRWKQLVPFFGGDYVGNLDLDIQVHSLDANLFAAHPLPRQVVLGQVSADLLRIAVRERFVLVEDVQSFFDRLIRRSLAEGFGPDVQLAFDWSALARSLNDSVGGPDGATVTPLLIRAHAILPFSSNKMLVSSSLGRLVGMTVGTSGEFDLGNDGLWNAEYAVAYPKGVHVRVRDSAGLTQDENWGEREGFRVSLARGASTRIHIDGRSDFEVDVFIIGLLELGILAFFLWTVFRRLRTIRRGKTAYDAA